MEVLVWWKIRLLDYLLKCPKIQINCFTSQICCLKSLMELWIQEPFVFHSTKAWPLFHEENRITLRGKTFCFFKRIIFFLAYFKGKKKMHSSFSFSEGEEKTYSFCFLGKEKRDFSQRDNWKKKNFLFSFPETAHPFSYLFGSGRVRSLRHPNPTPISPTCTRWVELVQSLIQVHSIPLLKVIHIDKWLCDYASTPAIWGL